MTPRRDSEDSMGENRLPEERLPEERLAEERLAEAARRAAERERAGREVPEPSLGARLGQIGVMGWMIVLPMLGGALLGRWIDRSLGTRITFAAALIMIGAVLGARTAWRWIQRS